jgi:hypothetical protein
MIVPLPLRLLVFAVRVSKTLWVPVMLTVPVKAVEAPVGTVTVAVPNLAVSAVEVALTVRVVRVSAAAMVSKPLVLIVVPEFLPVSTIVQVTVCAGLLVPFTFAVNGCVAPLATLAVAGLTVTPVTAVAGVKPPPLSATSGSSQAKNAMLKPASKRKLTMFLEILEFIFYSSKRFLTL